VELIDTHTHIYLPEFNADRDESLRRALENNVSRLLMPNIDLSSVAGMMSAAEKYPGICMPMMGLHPTSVKEDWREQLDGIKRLACSEGYIAIGEIGIDLYWDKTYLKEQLMVFGGQLELALELDLPVVIHSRDAFNEIFTILEGFAGRPLRGVFHAFTGDINTAEKAISMGFMLGIGGIVTFKNSGLDDVVSQISIENIILETDSPYLAPVPHRGKRNESSYIALINSRLAAIFGITPEQAAEMTTGNAKRLFRLE
jgi:TatD DNase family protein